MSNVIKKIISYLLDQAGYSIIQKGNLKTLTGEELPFNLKMIPKEEHTFSHPMVHGYPSVQLKVYEINCTQDDIQIATRLLNSYHKALKDEHNITSKLLHDLWEILKQVRHNDFVQLLERNNPTELAQYLCNMSKLPISHGMVQGLDNYNRIISDEAIRYRSAAYHMDKLVALAEAVGCIPCENPEFGRWGENLYMDINELIAKIEETVGIDITPPKISGGLFGISSKKGLFHFRDITSIYTAWRIRELVQKINDPSICEIGAGTGRVPYYCYKMGIKNFTIIDLPYVCVVSGYYLIKSLPDANVVLYGEKNDETMNSIKIYPYWCFKEMPDDYFDLTLNQDSFPEIAYPTVMEYLHHIRHKTKKYFLSINQESQAPQPGNNNLQLVVSQLVRELGDAYERVYRFPYWIREGYLEELFKIVK